MSWNVNGLRACDRKGFRRWLERSGASVVGIQEVRAEAEQLPKRLVAPKGWHVEFSSAQRPGYSGVGLYARRKPDAVDTALGVRSFDEEGRLQLARFGRLVVANVYFPNGNGKERDNSRVPYKLRFTSAVFERLERLRRAGHRVLVMGDFNTAHREIDLARPKDNQKTSGFLPVERAAFDALIGAGWIDTFRHAQPEPGHYSWWSQRGDCRARNVGWRIDYVLASPAAMRFVRDAFILRRVQGSDHCPVGVEVDPGIYGTRTR
ncbi:MAG: exodeoxyribonuclease III [Myxococcota bacterium]